MKRPKFGTPLKVSILYCVNCKHRQKQRSKSHEQLNALREVGKTTQATVAFFQK
jgi:hypothetical protein